MTCANWGCPSGAMPVQHQKCWDVWQRHTRMKMGTSAGNDSRRNGQSRGEGEGNEKEDGRGQSNKYKR